MEGKLFDLASDLNIKVLLIIGGASWLLISVMAIGFCMRFISSHWKKESEFRKQLESNSEKVKVDIHDIRNFLNKYGGTIEILSRDSQRHEKELNRHAHNITAIRTTLHLKGIMRPETMEDDRDAGH